MARKPVLIVTGPPGAGKTTTAHRLVERTTPGVHLEADAFFRFIRTGYVEPWEPESRRQNEVVMPIVARAAAGYASAGYFTVVDGIVIPGWFLDPLRQVLQEAGHEVAFAVLRPALPLCVARAQGRTREPLEPEVIERLWQSFAELGELERHVIDLADGSPEEAADAVEEQLATGALAI